MELKKLSLGNQMFCHIIEHNLTYADKTKYIYELLQSENKNYLLLRPRRFGKTLLLTTIQELFSGNPERFKGLWIGKSDYDFPKLPVIQLSMTMNSDSPKLLQKTLLSRLQRVAESYNLDVFESDPYKYFIALIQAVSKVYNSKVVVLIDECDAAVTRRMDNLKLAQENAFVLHKFFGTLKDPEVYPNLRLSFITGITRYALPSINSSDKYLTDISLDPNYAGICGFTLDDFDSLFSDRLDNTLEELKKKGAMMPFTSVHELKDRIYMWYNGYNFGGETRVLNPWNILYFFRNITFNSYWNQSGRPGHLDSMIKAKPIDFIQATNNTYSESELKKSDLNQLEAVPVLFHSGYLTIDKTITNTLVNDSKSEFSYSFRFPDYEVCSTYYSDLFDLILQPERHDEFRTNGKILREAIFKKNAKTISLIFTEYLARIAYFQRPEDEKTYNAFVEFILSALGFDVKIEIPGKNGRMDLYFKLKDNVYAIASLRHVSKKKKLTKADEMAVLARLATKNLTAPIKSKYIVAAVEAKLGPRKVNKLLRKSEREIMTNAEMDKILLSAKQKVLSK
ncbi:MAG: AAA family ATPase, partial [Endomicrobium sp.]|nr:AAA family ATPase [Endomicrobium sp.]